MKKIMINVLGYALLGILYPFLYIAFRDNNPFSFLGEIAHGATSYGGRLR